MREIEDNINRWQDIPCSWIRRVATAKMTLLLKAVYRFSAVSIKIPMAVSTALEQRNVRFCMEIQKALNWQNNLEKGQSWKNHTSWLHTTLQKRQPSKHSCRNRCENQRHQIENPEITPHTSGQFIYNKWGESIQWRKARSRQYVVLEKLESYMWTWIYNTFSSHVQK